MREWNVMPGWSCSEDRKETRMVFFSVSWRTKSFVETLGGTSSAATAAIHQPAAHAESRSEGLTCRCFFIFIFMLFFYFSLLRMCLEFISAPFTVSRRGTSALTRQGIQLITHNSGGIPPRLIPQLIPSRRENRCFLDPSAPQRQSFFFLSHSR